MASARKRQRLSKNGDFKTTVPQEDPAAPTAQPGDDHEWSSARPTSSLFVRSLPLTATTQALTNLFSHSYPLKHAVVILDRETGKSRGFGFVTFADVEDARQAKAGLHDVLFEGRKLQIDFAKPRHRTSRDGRDDPSAPALPDAQGAETAAPAPTRGRQADENCRLIVRNLPWSVKEPQQLARLFLSYGKVKDATLPKCKPGLSPGFGFVAIRGKSNAERAIAGVNGKVVDGRSVAVDWAVDKSTWQQLQLGDAQPTPTEPTGAFLVDGPLSSRGAQGSGDESSRNSGEDTSSSPDAPGAEAIGSGSEHPEDSLGPPKQKQTQAARDNVSSTLFVRNLPYSATDEDLLECFKSFGAIRYARVVIDPETARARGTGFVSFYNREDARQCLLQAPHTHTARPDAAEKKGGTHPSGLSILHDPSTDPFGRFTMNDRIVQVSQAVEKDEAHRRMIQRKQASEIKDDDRRHLYLLTEELRTREQNLSQRQKMVKDNPALFLSLTRISVRNLPRHIQAKDLKALAREAVVGFAKDVKAGQRQPLTKEEQRRDMEQMKVAETTRRLKGVGIVKQAKIIYESHDGAKTAASGDGTRSRGYGFIEYSSHRWALMGLRWLNGHQIQQAPTRSDTDPQAGQKSKRLIAEFAIENAHVVARRANQANGAHRPSTAPQQKLARENIRSHAQSDLESKLTGWQAGKGGRDEALRPAPPTAEAVSRKDASRKSSQGVQHLIGRKRASRKAGRRGSR